VKLGILGAGLAGLTLANHLKFDHEILEKNPEVGGLCRSMTERGWTFDTGGSHIIFSRDEKIMDYMLSLLGSNVVRNRRHTKIFIKGRFVKYPLENGLSDLPIEDNFNCIYHYVDARLKEERGELKEPRTFKQWLYNNFGKGMADIYLVPYNEKIWRRSCDEMGVDWVGGRVPHPPMEDIIKSSLGIETEGYTHQLHFYYPRTGGIQSLVSALEKNVKLRIEKSVKITKISRKGIKWAVECADATRTYDRLVSTIPLMDIVNLLDDVPANVRKAIAGLKYTSLVEVMLGLDGPLEKNISWLYIPSYSDARFNRVSFPSYFSPKTTPPGCSSILIESTCNEGDEVWRKPDSKLIDETVRDLKKMTVVGESQKVRFAKVARAKYAYVVFDLDYAKKMKVIRDYFAKAGIELCGRFSEFKYLNMDATMASALKMAKTLNKKGG